MRKEIENWWKQGINDYEKAKVLHKSGNYDGAAFYSQQSVEKCLKAVILRNEKQKTFEGHSLIHLGKTAKVPETFYTSLRKLSPQYFLSRYPDVTEEVPYELYDEPSTREYLQTAEEVMKWTEKQLKQPQDSQKK